MVIVLWRLPRSTFRDAVPKEGATSVVGAVRGFADESVSGMRRSCERSREWATTESIREAAAGTVEWYSAENVPAVIDWAGAANMS
jgi:hypothetical protein